MADLREEFIPISNEEFSRRLAAREALTFKEREEKDARLLQAAQDGTGYEELYPALQQGAWPDAIDRNGFSGLMRASDKGHAACVRILLAGRADPLLEAPAILKNGQIVPKRHSGYTPQYGDITVTAPLLAIINCHPPVLNVFATFKVEIPEYWHEIFLRAAREFNRSRDAGLRSSILYNTRKLLKVSRPG